MSLYKDVFEHLHPREKQRYQSRLLIEAVRTYCTSKAGTHEEERHDGTMFDYKIFGWSNYATLQANVNPPKLVLYAEPNIAEQLVNNHEEIEHGEKIRYEADYVHLVIHLTVTLPSQVIVSAIDASFTLQELELHEKVLPHLKKVYRDIIPLLDREPVIRDKIDSLIKICELDNHQEKHHKST